MSADSHGYPRASRAFLGCGLFAGLVVVGGAGLLLMHERGDAVMRFPTPMLLGQVLRHPSAEGVVYLGLAGLLCLPFVRNLGLAFGLFRRGERAAAALALSSCLLLFWLYEWLSRQP